MDNSTKEKFLLAVHKHTLGAYASGGLLGIPGALTVQNDYNANQANTDYTGYGNFIGSAGDNVLAGNNRFGAIADQQQALSNQLQQNALGNGPNPAQAALAQQTGQNVANQGALMAGQRGAGANIGLLARQAAQQGAATQQQAVGQGATLQAQQQLAAQSALAQQQQAMQQANAANQGVNSNFFGTSAGAQNTQNANNIQNAAMAQGINAQVAQNNANSVNATQKGLIGGAASALGSLVKFADGGKVENHFHQMARIYHPHLYADGGDVGKVAQISTPNLMMPIDNSPGLDPISSFRNGMKPGTPMSDSLSAPEIGSEYAGSGYGLGVEGVSAPAAGAGLGVETSLAPLAVAFNSGGKIDKNLSANGGSVKSMSKDQKAVKKGDSYENDKIPALLSEGEHVIDRETMEDPGPLGKAARFVAASIAQKNRGKK